jgi:hypothetical protein
MSRIEKNPIQSRPNQVKLSPEAIIAKNACRYGQFLTPQKLKQGITEVSNSITPKAQNIQLNQTKGGR